MGIEKISVPTSLQNSLFMKALRGEQVRCPPIWMMRQAGRYLPEYRAVREKISMLGLIRSPELACEVTLQPIRRYGFDAAIIFADILNPLIGMGIELDFVEKEGPKIFNPLQSVADIERLRVPLAEENVPGTLAAIRLVSAELTPKGIPLFGFAGAPFTLSSYLFSDPEHERVRLFMRNEEKAFFLLQEKLVALLSEYLIAQVKAGASVLQLFDSWVGTLSAAEFAYYVLPSVKAIVEKVKAVADVPFFYFPLNGAPYFSQITAESGIDGISVDWRSSLTEARTTLPAHIALQGNLDPTVLFAKKEVITREAKRIVAEGRSAGRHIFNLGHGIKPPTPIDAVHYLLEAVRG